jgi:hypothetical protein
MPRAQLKDEGIFRALRKKGNSEEKSGRIANAAGTSRKAVAQRGGRSRSYDKWTKKDLLERAREIGIKGRSLMSKAQLISALRKR